MAAPTVSSRTIDLTGDRMPDGFRSLVCLSLKPDIQIWEMSGVKPPGVDGGEKIKTTTMHNKRFHTYRSRKLLNITDISFKALYDPDVINDILGQVNLEQSVTFLYPDGSKEAVWGYLQKFEPDGMDEGKAPEATCTIAITNVDPTGNPGGEDGPVFVPAAGT